MIQFITSPSLVLIQDINKYINTVLFGASINYRAEFYSPIYKKLDSFGLILINSNINIKNIILTLLKGYTNYSIEEVDITEWEQIEIN